MHDQRLMIALLIILSGLTATAPAAAVAGCWHPAAVPGVVSGSITDLTVGGGKLWISVVPRGEPVPGWGGESSNIVRLDLATGSADDVTKALHPDNPRDEETHVWIDEKHQEIWVTADRGCGRPESFGFDLTWHTPHEPGCPDPTSDPREDPRRLFINERAEERRRVLKPEDDFLLAHDERQTLVSLVPPADIPGDANSIVYLRRPGHKAVRVFTSASRWTVKNGALSPQLALIAGGPHGLVLIDRLTGKRVRNRACTGKIWVSSVAIAGERVFVGTSKGLFEVPLRELGPPARRRARKRK
jgi:hypothetical protein